MQAEIAYRLAVREARRQYWAGLSYQVETILTTVTVVGTLAILMVPGINRSTTEWYSGIAWLHAPEQATDQAAAAGAEPKAIAADARIFPIPGQTHAIAVKENIFTSGYGPRPAPGGIGSNFHRGHDYAAPTGTPLLATESGTVEIWEDSGCGNGLEIKAAERSLIYCHLNEFKVKNGQTVKAGDVVGTVGSTGNSTGPHLHFGLIENGDYVDPTQYLASLPSSLEEQEPAAGESSAPVDQSIDASKVEEYLAELQGAEFGKKSKLMPMRDARIEVLGDASEEDRRHLAQVVKELRDLGAGDLQVVPSGGNVQMHFAPPDQFSALEPKYRPGNLGFFWRRSDGGFARILITSTDRVTQQERYHLIREELTQVLTGLGRDSNRYPDSIFYQGWADVNEFSEMDRAVIRRAFQS